MAPKMRRPAAAARPDRRRRGALRPAAHHEEVGAAGDEALPWDPKVGDLVIADGAHYFGAPCRFTGRILEDSRDAAGRHLAIRLHGTDHEPLLTWASGASVPARVHLCPEGCSREAEGPGLLHCHDIRSIRSLEELAGVPWRDVLLEGKPRAEDELAGLRSRMDGIGGPSPGAVAAAAEIEEKEKKERSEKEKKKSKKKKKKKRKRGRSSKSRSEASKKEKEKNRRGEKPCQFEQLDKQFIHSRVQGSATRGAVPGVRLGSKHPDSQEATPTSSTIGQALTPPQGGQQVGIFRRPGRVGPEGGSGVRRISENQRDRIAVPRRSLCTSHRSDAGSLSAGARPRSTSRRSMERDISQILQTNIIPQDVRADVQRSPNALDNRRSIVEGHGAGGTRHPDPAAEVAGSPVDRASMDVLPENGIIAPRRGQPFAEAGAFDSGSRASCGSEGPSGRGLERVEQGKRRKSRKRRWREGKRQKGKDKTQEGLEEGGHLRSPGSIAEIRTGRECPGKGFLQLEQRVTSGAQVGDTDSTAASLDDRGLNPALDHGIDDEALGAQLKRQTIDLAGGASPANRTTNGGGHPVEAESEDATFPPLPPGNFSVAEPNSVQPEVAFDGYASGFNAPGQSPARLAQSGKGLCGKRLWEMGGDLVDFFRRVSSLCSQSGERRGSEVFRI